jgi:hypothetical protein
MLARIPVLVVVVLGLVTAAGAFERVDSFYWNTGQPPVTTSPGRYVERIVDWPVPAEDVGRPIIGWLLNVIAEPIGAGQSILAQLINGTDATEGEIAFLRTPVTANQVAFLPAGTGIPAQSMLRLWLRCWNQTTAITTTCRASVRVYYLE